MAKGSQELYEEADKLLTLYKERCRAAWDVSFRELDGNLSEENRETESANRSASDRFFAEANEAYDEAQRLCREAARWGPGPYSKRKDLVKGKMRERGTPESSGAFYPTPDPLVELYERRDGGLTLWLRGEPVAHDVTREVGESTFGEDALRLALRGSKGWELPRLGMDEDWGETRASLIFAYGCMSVSGAPGALALEYLERSPESGEA